MKYRRIRNIYQFASLLICLIILGQNVVKPQVLCMRPDGSINIEAGCSAGFRAANYYTDTNEEHQDICKNCVDIPIWNHHPSIASLVKTVDHNLITFEVNTEIFSQGESQKSITYFISPDIQKNHFPPFIKNTYLLI